MKWIEKLIRLIKCVEVFLGKCREALTALTTCQEPLTDLLGGAEVPA